MTFKPVDEILTASYRESGRTNPGLDLPGGTSESGGHESKQRSDDQEARRGEHRLSPASAGVRNTDDLHNLDLLRLVALGESSMFAFGGYGTAADVVVERKREVFGQHNHRGVQLGAVPHR